MFVFGIDVIGLLRMNLENIKTNQPEWNKSTPRVNRINKE